MNSRFKDVGVEETPIRGQQDHGASVFPVVLQCRQTAGVGLESVAGWLSEHRDDLIQRAARDGAILFRGFPVSTAEDFDAFVSAFSLPNFPYDDSLSNAVRINRTPRVFTANEAPPTATIYLHHEMAQTPFYPSRLFFFCEQPATRGGETPLCRSDVLWERLVECCPSFARDCETKGARYSNVMPPENDPGSGMGRSWQSTLRARDRAGAEQRLRELGYSWEWLDNDCLRASTPVLPVVHHFPGGRASFFNQLIAAYQGWKDSRNDPDRSITFGDGSLLDRSSMLAACDLAEELSFDLPWERGDVALVDNFVTMHGRRTFSGTRKVLASLVATEA